MIYSLVLIISKKKLKNPAIFNDHNSTPKKNNYTNPVMDDSGTENLQILCLCPNK